MEPLNNAFAPDQPFALVGSDDVLYEKAVGPHWYVSTQMFLGAWKKICGATAAALMPVCLADAIWLQSENGAKFMDPYALP